MKRFTNILVSVDARSDIHPALQWASPLAERNQAKLKIIDVLPEFPWYMRTVTPDHEHMRELLLDEKRERLEAIAAPLHEKGIEVTTKTASGKSSVEIVREAMRGRHDLVVRVAKGTNSRRRGFFGSTSFGLIRHCPCPVWIVKPDDPPRFEHILGAIDPMDEDEPHRILNTDVVDLARSIAESENGRFSLVHAWNVHGAKSLLAKTPPSEIDEVERQLRGTVDEAFDKFLSDHRMSINDENVHLINGGPSAAILKFARTNDVDLIVMGTVGRSGLSGFLMGNTAELILNWVECPVLALKPPDFTSQIKLD